jgi:endonuclease/exonuclease/phosphatase (EEP) superfamily protein YafD
MATLIWLAVLTWLGFNVGQLLARYVRIWWWDYASIITTWVGLMIQTVLAILVLILYPAAFTGWIVTLCIWLLTADFQLIPSRKLNIRHYTKYTLKLCSWNTRTWFKQTEVDTALKLLQTQQADIYLLQEVMQPNTHQVVEFADYRNYFPDYYLVQHHELVILSRFPIEVIKAAPITWPCANYVIARVHLTDGSFDVFNVHLPVPFELSDLHSDWLTFLQRTQFFHQQRNQLVRELADYALHSTRPVIGGGDFNATYPQRIIRLMSNEYRDLYREVGWGIPTTLNFADRYPFWRVDWLWANSKHRNQVKVVEYKRQRFNKYSDHAPINVVFEVTPTNAT